MSVSALGRRYALALLELAKEQNAMDKVLSDLAQVSDAWDASSDLRDLVNDPTVPRPAAKAALFGLLERFGSSQTVRGLIGVLADRGRLRYLPEVIEAFNTLAGAEAGRVLIEVTTAQAMPEGFYEQLRRKLERLSGDTLVFVKKEDPSLIGGVVTRVGDRVFDGSLRNQLDELKESLLARDFTI